MVTRLLFRLTSLNTSNCVLKSWQKDPHNHFIYHQDSSLHNLVTKFGWTSSLSLLTIFAYESHCMVYLNPLVNPPLKKKVSKIFYTYLSPSNFSFISSIEQILTENLPDAIHCIMYYIWNRILSIRDYAYADTFKNNSLQK